MLSLDCFMDNVALKAKFKCLSFFKRKNSSAHSATEKFQWLISCEIWIAELVNKSYHALQNNMEHESDGKCSGT